MARGAKQDWPMDLALLLARGSLGLLLAWAGIEQMTGGAIRILVDAVINRSPDWVPTPLARAVAYMLPMIETLVGLMLLLGFYSRFAAGVAVLVLFTLLVNLGFDGAGHWPMSPNVVLLTLAILLALTGPGSWSIETRWRRKRRF